MKIRIRGSSLRLRLLRSEVKRLADEGVVEETVDFGNGQCLRYRLESGGERMGAKFDSGAIRVFVPRETVREWAETDRVSLLGEQGPLRLLVEKDFTCINPRSVWQEDQSDNYPNPNPSCGGPGHG